MKTITRNHYIQCINQVVNYINNHLNETIVVEKLAQTANLSPFHFCRIFKAISATKRQQLCRKPSSCSMVSALRSIETIKKNIL